MLVIIITGPCTGLDKVVSLHWTFSRDKVSFCWYGSQTDVAIVWRL